MQSFIVAMLNVRQAFYAAVLKSLLRTKSLLQTFLNIWISPPSLVEVDSDKVISAKKRRDEFLENVRVAFEGSLEAKKLQEFSSAVKTQLQESLKDNPLCMLPSYNHQLPTGEECGTYLALDVGGSTFRVALIELSGKNNDGEECRVLKSKSVKIDRAVKELKGRLFFDWIANRIEDTLAGQLEGHDLSGTPLSMGLAWSFPIEQTSLRSGLLQGMGKGFLAADGLLGEDLGDLIQDACSKKGLNVQLNAIVNDSSATLLSKAYHDPTTRLALILGTGVNAAIHLPVHIFSPSKFGTRPSAWHDTAKHVIVNTELSMFGAGVLPFTKYDKLLLSTHPLPDFQPMEHFVSGGYLGEISRLVLVDGIENAGLFGGIVPPSLQERYSLETETLSRIESDTHPSLASAQAIFTSLHPSSYTPSPADIAALRSIAAHVTHRASSIVAAGVHALWTLRNEADGDDTTTTPPTKATNGAANGAVIEASRFEHTLVAYNGSVLENYPAFRRNCQQYLDALVVGSGGVEGGLELVYAEESSLRGAAVAVACLEG